MTLDLKGYKRGQDVPRNKGGVAMFVAIFGPVSEKPGFRWGNVINVSDLDQAEAIARTIADGDSGIIVQPDSPSDLPGYLIPQFGCVGPRELFCIRMIE